MAREYVVRTRYSRNDCVSAPSILRVSNVNASLPFVIRKSKMQGTNQLDDFLGGVGMVKNVDERIARIKQQREALAQRLNALEQKSKSEARKRDTRRKIIVGGAVIAQMEKVPDFANFIRTFLDASVGRQNDREAIADLLNAASGVASAVAPEKSGVSPAPRVPSAPVTPPTQPSATQPPPRVSSPLFTPRPDTQQPPHDPLASDIDNLSRLLGRKSE